jgi:hypothetical protein
MPPREKKKKKNCVTAAPVLLSLTTFLVIAFFPTLTKRLFRSWWEANVAVQWRQEELFIPLIHAIATHSNDGDAGPSGSVPTKHETSNKEKHTFRVSDLSFILCIPS